MKIIMLKGPDHSGKTTTLNLVYNELVNNRKAKICSYVKVGWKGDDFACTLDYYPSNCKNLKVAIYSMGDYVFDIERAIDYYTHKSVDVLIIANRNKSQFDHLAAQIITKKKVNKALINTDNMNYMMQIVNAI